MGTYSVDVSYKGGAFSGFARQRETHIITIQGEIERALGLLFRRDVPTVCAGRTDAGVHARGQVVSFDLDDEEFEAKGERSLLRSLNAITHEDISLRNLMRRPDGFSARFDAQWREYHYHMSTDTARPVLIADLVWHLPGVQLDLDAMNQAAAYCLGEHDFKSFCLSASAEGKSTNRCILALELYPETIVGERVITMRVVGNAFLHSMVRTLAGTMVEIGNGKHSPEWMQEVIEARSRSAAAQTAPAQGLVFWEVGY